MPSTFDFIFDVDDMLVDTEGEMCNIISRDHGFMCPVDTYLTVDNTNGHHTTVIGAAKFMATAPLLPHAVELFAALPELAAQNHRNHICTHRGYHVDGERHTLDMLDRHNVRPYFQDIHILDFNTIPDKVAYLDEVYGPGRYVLFDDRPRFEAGHPLPDHIWLFDRPWNRHIQGNRTTNVLATIHQLIKEREHVE